MKRSVRLVLMVLVPLIVFVLPTLTPGWDFSLQHRLLLAIFSFAVVSWVLEPIPVYATSLWVILLQLIWLSDKGLLKSGLSWQGILSSFSSPIIILFLGGFFLAAASSKSGLDRFLAGVFLKPFGSRPVFVLMGLILVTALFSMFMSNTATTAMMMTVIVPVLNAVAPDDPLQKALVVAIPFAANLGGMATPIGTPPNAIALKVLESTHPIGFLQWMIMALPFTILMLFLLWIVLVKMFPAHSDKVVLNLNYRFYWSLDHKIVVATTLVTFLLWLSADIHGLHASIVALVPVCVFSATGFVGKPELKQMGWDVLWLVAGGIALGEALDKSGLTAILIQQLPLQAMGPEVLAVCAILLCLLLSTFMSHTATANLILPMVSALGTIDGTSQNLQLVIGCCFACSLAMALPISTPPNALAFASNRIAQSDMVKAGSLIGFLGFLICVLVIIGY